MTDGSLGAGVGARAPVVADVDFGFDDEEEDEADDEVPYETLRLGVGWDLA